MLALNYYAAIAAGTLSTFMYTRFSFKSFTPEGFLIFLLPCKNETYITRYIQRFEVT